MHICMFYGEVTHWNSNNFIDFCNTQFQKIFSSFETVSLKKNPNSVISPSTVVSVKFMCCSCPIPWYFVCQTVALHSWLCAKEESTCWVHFLIILNNWCSFIKQALLQLMPKGWGMSFMGDGWMLSTMKRKCLIHVYYFSIYLHENQRKIEL